MKNKILVILVSTFVIVVFMMQCIQKDQSYSSSERRKLTTFPKVSINTISTGKFMSEFEDYSLDQFPLRDTFRSIKAYVQKDLFSRKDNNDYIYVNQHLSKLEYPYNPDMTLHAANVMNSVYRSYLAPYDIIPYLAIVPDKNYYLLDDHYLKMDYDKLAEDLYTKVGFKYIDLYSELTIDDYYYTDTHWKQENIEKVAKKIASAMGKELSQEYEKVTLEDPFYGVYYGQSALHVKGDKITYLTNDMLEGCKVDNLETNTTGCIYNMKKATSKDPYELFLSGAVSLLHITNPSVEEEAKLIIFRDSFASSLTPLLVENYHEIYLVDLRYVQSTMLRNYIDFEGADVLFIYSTLVLNQSLSLK